MATMDNKVIVFGPTGGVGSAVARTAHEQGAKVALAMRDPQKPIPGLSNDQEREGRFERLQADLADPESIKAAVTKSGAKYAFIYLLWGAPDGMRRALEALKSAGIEFVVFLSSVGVTIAGRGDPGSVPPTNVIAWAHAQVEMNLADVFGPEGYVAVRPAFFASNTLMQWKAMLRTGQVKLVCPDAVFDYISPSDIGRVCGRLLVGVRPALDGGRGPNSITLAGPKLVSQRDAVATIGRAIGRDLKATEVDISEGLEMFKATGMPEPRAKQAVQILKDRLEGRDDFFGGRAWEEAAADLEKYGGQPATGLAEWAEENKEQFNA